MSDKKIYEDQILICKSCGTEFIFTANEQRFFEEKGFGAPIRCQSCRNAKKARNEAREEKPTKQMSKEYQVDAEENWAGAMLERWNEHLVLFGNKD